VLVTAAASDEVLILLDLRYEKGCMYAENSRIDGGEREMCEMFDLLGLVLDGESVYCFFLSMVLLVRVGVCLVHRDLHSDVREHFSY